MVCMCGCGQKVPYDRAGKRRFASNACRQKAYRLRKPDAPQVSHQTITVLRLLAERNRRILDKDPKASADISFVVSGYFHKLTHTQVLEILRALGD